MASIKPVIGPDVMGTGTPRKKQLMILGGGVAIIAAIVLIAAWMADTNPKPDSRAAATKANDTFVSTAIVPGSQINEKDTWKANESSKIEALNQDMAGLKDAMKRQEQQKMLTGNQPMLGMPANSIPNGGAQNRANPWMPSTALPPPPPPPPPLAFNRQQQGLGQPVPTRAGLGQQPGLQGAAQAAANDQAMRSTFTLEIGPGAEGGNKVAMAGKPAGDGSAASDDAGRKKTAGDGAKEKAEDYLPAGTFMRVQMLSGMEAPTGGQAQSNPTPALFRVLDHAQLPNSFRARIKACAITANGFGDISSERAYIRTDRLSCVDEDGGVLDVPIKGYVAGEDGKAGMHGHLVTKQGQALANAFMVGLGSGLGSAFRSAATTTSTSALGTTATVTPGKELEAGLGAGLGTAMDRLAKYYIDLANKLFPVVEVDAGRVVDIVLTKGVSIERR
jgi:conjugal transfer pilus assembly protein TraB